MGINRIVVTRSVAALVAEADEEIERDSPNDDASIDRWGELLQVQLREQLPGADIEIRIVRASPAGLDIDVQADSAEEERSARKAVGRICKALDDSGEWVVPEVGG